LALYQQFQQRENLAPTLYIALVGDHQGVHSFVFIENQADEPVDYSEKRSDGG